MADNGSPKPPATPSGDVPALQPATLPATNDPVRDIQTATTSAAPSEPALPQSAPIDQPSITSTLEGSSLTGNSAPRPEASLIQDSGRQDGTTHTTQQTQVPALPTRTYPRDSRWLTYGTLPAALPSRVLPRFFKVLAIVIFVTGTSATLLTFVYQRFVLPKLMLTRARLAALHHNQVSLYDKLLSSAQSLVFSSDNLYPKTQQRIAQLSAPDPTLPVAAQQDMTKVEGALPQEKTVSESDEEEPLFADESPLEKSKQLKLPSTEEDGVMTRLQLSLGKLQSALKPHGTIQSNAIVTMEDDDEESTLPDQTQAQKTLKSLEGLSTFLTNEAFYASTPAFSAASYGWNHGGSSSMPQRSGMDRDKIAQVKNEIRSLKGMLLTRRNFAIPKPEISV